MSATDSQGASSGERRLVVDVPNLAPIVRGPFYAMKLYPGDIGTKGGLLTEQKIDETIARIQKQGR